MEIVKMRPEQLVGQLANEAGVLATAGVEAETGRESGAEIVAKTGQETALHRVFDIEGRRAAAAQPLHRQHFLVSREKVICEPDRQSLRRKRRRREKEKYEERGEGRRDPRLPTRDAWNYQLLPKNSPGTTDYYPRTLQRLFNYFR